jgi:hypothetical protein
MVFPVPTAVNVTIDVDIVNVPALTSQEPEQVIKEPVEQVITPPAPTVRFNIENPIELVVPIVIVPVVEELSNTVPLTIKSFVPMARVLAYPVQVNVAQAELTLTVTAPELLFRMAVSPATG